MEYKIWEPICLAFAKVSKVLYSSYQKSKQALTRKYLQVWCIATLTILLIPMGVPGPSLCTFDGIARPLINIHRIYWCTCLPNHL
jgi:hypothetical protein